MKSFKEARGDGQHTRSAKERIKRERRSDAQKFDRILDRAAVADAKERAAVSKPRMEETQVDEVYKVPAGMKFIASYVYKDAKGKDHTHRHLRKGTKMTDPVVVYIDGKEWKTFDRFTKAKQAAINHIKTMKEETQIDERRNAGQSATGYDIYHKTYSDAMQHAYAHAKKKHGVTVRSSEIDRKVAMGPRKPSTGKTVSHILKTDSRKNLHVQVYNTGKSYELNMYVEDVRSYTQQPDVDRFLDRVINKSKYKKAIRFYLDLRKKNPGKAKENAIKASKITGGDFRNLEKVFHDMIKKGKLPKHLAWRKDLVERIAYVVEQVKTIKVGEDVFGADEAHYILVKERKVMARGSKKEMLSRCQKEGGRVWLSTKDVGDIVEGVAQDPDIKDKKGTQPKKYYSGMKKSTKSKRDAHFKKGAKMDDDNPEAYKPAPGDKGAKTKPSKYTTKFKKMYGEENIEESAEAGLKNKAEKSGISVGILRQVYKRGVAAWRTGHRPGTTPQQWGMARVNSFITGGKTRRTADADLWKRVRK